MTEADKRPELSLDILNLEDMFQVVKKEIENEQNCEVMDPAIYNLGADKYMVAIFNSKRSQYPKALAALIFIHGWNGNLEASGFFG